MEIIFIFCLIIANGVLAMTEIAIITAKKSSLKRQAQSGDSKAGTALKLAESPATFLSTIQIGISFIGIFAGAYSGGTIARQLAVWLDKIPIFTNYSESLALLITVALITYFTLVIGELVPKRLALHNPEKIAKAFSKPIYLLSIIASPLVKLLSVSSSLVLRLIPTKPNESKQINDDDIKTLISEGARTGAFQLIEKNIVERTLLLSDATANVLMTPRGKIIWLDNNSSPEQIKNVIATSPQAFYPVYQDSLDTVVGVIHTQQIIKQVIQGEEIDLQSYMHQPLFIEETTDGLRVLQLFKQSGVHLGLVINSKGIVQGLVSLTDILEALVGGIPTAQELKGSSFVTRKNGTVLVDGSVSIGEFGDYFELGEEFILQHQSQTNIASLVATTLNKLPKTGDTVTITNFSLEIVDMDDNRIDKLLVKRL